MVSLRMHYFDLRGMVKTFILFRIVIKKLIIIIISIFYLLKCSHTTLKYEDEGISFHSTLVENYGIINKAIWYFTFSI